jgi:hypothetical protein
MTARLDVLIVPIILVILAAVWGVVYYYQHDGVFDEEEDSELVYPDDYELKEEFFVESGYLDENSEEIFIFNLTEPNIISLNFTLTWVDENENSSWYINDPDEFALSIKPHVGDEVSSPPSTLGEIVITFEFEPRTYPDYNKSYEYKVKIITGEAGDQNPLQPSLLGVRPIEDTGNDWHLIIEYEYYDE